MKKELALLRVLRAAHQPKITQAHVARLAGLSAGRYWQIENGEGASPSRDEQLQIAQALGVGVADIAWPYAMTRSSTYRSIHI